MSLLLYLLDRDAQHESTVVHRLDDPWCWPIDSELARVARLITKKNGPRESRTGALLVGVDAHGARGALFHARRDRAALRDVVPLVFEAAASARLGARLVSRVLSVTASASTGEYTVEVLHDPDRVAALDGPSYGLALTLGCVEAALGGAALETMAASAVVYPDGTLGPVAHVATKTRTLVNEALGVRALFVVRSQVAEAELARDEAFERARIPPQRRWLEIVGVDTLREAVHRTFGSGKVLAEKLVGRVRDAETALGLVEELYRAALFGDDRVLDWSATAEVAMALDESPGLASTLDVGSRWKLDVTRAIALRHGGAPFPLALPTQEHLGAMHRAYRLRHMAHAVQAAVDTNDENVPALVERALATVRPALERATEDFVLLGALGRAHAAGNHYDEAIETLAEAVEGWITVREPNEASYSLAELLRVAGCRATERGMSVDERLEGWLDGPLRAVLDHPRTTDVSRGYLYAAAARATTQGGMYEQSLAWSSRTRELALHPHVDASLRRWKAIAHAALGRHDDAHAARSELAGHARADDSLSVYAELASLDDAVEQAKDVTGLLATLGKELADWLAVCPPGRPRIDHVRHHYRY